MRFLEDSIELSKKKNRNKNFWNFVFFSPMSIDSEAINHLLSKSDVVQALLHDLIGFFAQPSLTLDHEERQIRLKVLRNRQDLFQEEVGKEI
jgi:hypothetical protein